MKYRFRDITVDPVRRTIERDGVQCPVPARAFDALIVLLENRERIVSRRELLDTVWPDVVVEDGNLTQNVSVLRKAIGDRSADDPVILTVSGQGYRFTAEVTVVAADAIVAPPMTRLRWSRFAPVLVLMILAIAFAATARRSAKETREAFGLSIAVLPIRSGGFDQAADDTTMKLTNGVIAGIAAANPGVSVRSSSAVAEFTDPWRDTATEAGRQLDVSLVLEGFEGEVDGERFVEMQLIDVERDAVVWSGRVVDARTDGESESTLESRICQRVGVGLRSTKRDS